MTDEALRQLIREAVARHTGQPRGVSPPQVPGATAAGAAESGRVVPPVSPRSSMAFSLYVVPRPSGETDCVIEPGTRCDHCGYCLSHGH
jgi:hypothetical protein